MSHDITSRKETELSLRHANDELQRGVAERTDLLEQRAREIAGLMCELTQAEERERHRIAELLHDGLQQLLVAASMHVDLLRAECAPPVKESLNTIYGVLDDAIQTSRSMARELAPPVLHEGGLLPALEWLVGWVKDKHHLKVDLTVEGGAGRMHAEADELLYKSTRELLLNVVKHAGVDRAALVLARRDGLLSITVDDGGSGFDPDLAVSRHGEASFGLASIRERLSLLGGHMDIDSAPGQGARFTMTVPLTKHHMTAAQPARRGD